MFVLRALLRSVCCGDQLEEAHEEISRLVCVERSLRDDLAVERQERLAAALGGVHHDCVPRDEMVRLAHRVDRAEMQVEIARDHAAHVASACRCDGINHGETA